MKKLCVLFICILVLPLFCITGCQTNNDFIQVKSIYVSYDSTSNTYQSTQDNPVFVKVHDDGSIEVKNKFNHYRINYADYRIEY